MRGSVLVLLVLLGGCMPPPPPAPPRPEARRVHRPAYRPILIPVRDHVPDSIAGAFPAIEPPVADEAIYGRPGLPGRVMRATLPDPAAQDENGTPRLATSEDRAE